MELEVADGEVMFSDDCIEHGVCAAWIEVD